MTHYELEQHPGGEIVLPSGRWRWFVIRVLALPERACDFQQLIFASEETRGDIMRTRVPPDILTLDDASIQNYGLNPDERTSPSEIGAVTIHPPDPRALQHDRAWIIRPENRLPFRNSHAIDKPLGALTKDDIARLTRG